MVTNASFANLAYSLRGSCSQQCFKYPWFPRNSELFLGFYCRGPVLKRIDLHIPEPLLFLCFLQNPCADFFLSYALEACSILVTKLRPILLQFLDRFVELLLVEYPAGAPFGEPPEVSIELLREEIKILG